MDAEKVIEKILADAQSQADKIRSESAEKEKQEDSRLARQLDDYRKQTELLAAKEAETKKSRLLAAARMQLAKEYLAEKRKIIDDIFSQTAIRVKNLPHNEYRNLMAKLIIQAVETGDEEIVVDKNESLIDSSFVQSINDRLRDKGKGNLKLSDERQNLKAGFVLKKGKIKTNASLDVLLGQARKDLEITLSKELFGNEK